jgi:hypothetical protein
MPRKLRPEQRWLGRRHFSASPPASLAEVCSEALGHILDLSTIPKK